MHLVGVDFTCRPSRRKPVVVALGVHEGSGVRLTELALHPTLASFAAALQTPGPWVGGFDLPFGLPRELVQHLGWPAQWLPLMRHYAALPRDEIRRCFAAFCAARPSGGKFAHRACDGPAGSSPSMKWVNPPVAFMLHAGVPLLIDAGLHLPGVHAGDRARMALEAYPGLLARELIGRRSYKSDSRAGRTAERAAARGELLHRLERGATRLDLRVVLTDAQRDLLLADASGDRLDALLCLLQAAWASGRRDWGLPPQLDPLEGWIASAPWPPPAGGMGECPAGGMGEFPADGGGEFPADGGGEFPAGCGGDLPIGGVGELPAGCGGELQPGGPRELPAGGGGGFPVGGGGEFPAGGGGKFPPGCGGELPVGGVGEFPAGCGGELPPRGPRELPPGGANRPPVPLDDAC